LQQEYGRRSQGEKDERTKRMKRKEVKRDGMSGRGNFTSVIQFTFLQNGYLSYFDLPLVFLLSPLSILSLSFCACFIFIFF
jgi:hypothetical protein